MAKTILAIDYDDVERLIYALAALEHLRTGAKNGGADLLTPDNSPALREMFTNMWPMVAMPLGEIVTGWEESHEMVSLEVETRADARDALLAAKMLREALALQTLEGICNSAGLHDRARAMASCRLKVLEEAARILGGDENNGGKVQACWF